MVKKEEAFFIGAAGLTGAAILYYLIGKGKPPEILAINSAGFIPTGGMANVSINSAGFIPTGGMANVSINSAEFIPILGETNLRIDSAEFIAT